MVDQETRQAAWRRLRRKLEILKEDFKNINHTKHHDVVECIALMNMVEKADAERETNSTSNKEDMGTVSGGDGSPRDS